MKEQYYIQVTGETVSQAKNDHVAFFESIQEAITAAFNAPKEALGLSYSIRRVSDDVIVKKGVIAWLN